MAKRNQLILCDTNILISIIRNDVEIVNRFTSLEWDDLFISIITYGEVLVGARKREVRRTKSFLKSFGIVELDATISAQLRQIFNEAYYHKNLLADALIAATAVTYDLPLWTTNKTDFQYVPGIRFFNP